MGISSTLSPTWTSSYLRSQSRLDWTIGFGDSSFLVAQKRTAMIENNGPAHWQLAGPIVEREYPDTVRVADCFGSLTASHRIDRIALGAVAFVFESLAFLAEVCLFTRNLLAIDNAWFMVTAWGCYPARSANFTCVFWTAL